LTLIFVVFVFPCVFVICIDSESKSCEMMVVVGDTVTDANCMD